MNVESDHKPLEIIMRKTLDAASEVRHKLAIQAWRNDVPS